MELLEDTVIYLGNWTYDGWRHCGASVIWPEIPVERLYFHFNCMNHFYIKLYIMVFGLFFADIRWFTGRVSAESSWSLSLSFSKRWNFLLVSPRPFEIMLHSAIRCKSAHRGWTRFLRAARLFFRFYPLHSLLPPILHVHPAFTSCLQECLQCSAWSVEEIATLSSCSFELELLC